MWLSVETLAKQSLTGRAEKVCKAKTVQGWDLHPQVERKEASIAQTAE